MKSNNFYDFINTNKNVSFNIFLKRGGHPFIRAIYANGYKRDISLRNKTPEECLTEFKTTTQLCKIYYIYKKINSWKKIFTT